MVQGDDQSALSGGQARLVECFLEHKTEAGNKWQHDDLKQFV